MRMEELELVCQEAARGLVEREPRPLRPAVVLPLPAATQVTALDGFPQDDAARFEFLSRFAAERMMPENAPCYGFVSEASLDAEGADVVVIAYGARRQRARIVAAPLSAEGLGPFGESEELDPVALPFLSPLQHAADAARSPDAGAGPVSLS